MTQQLDPFGHELKNRNHSMLPEHIRVGMVDYLVLGILPGDFCIAVLTNDLLQSYARADHINRIRMPDILDWVYMTCPMAARGDFAALSKWCAVRKAVLKEFNENLNKAKKIVNDLNKEGDDL